jgi:hypothetical protein
LASVTFTSGQPALASVPPALAVATPVFGSTFDCTSSLTKAFTSCAMAGAAAVASTIASIATNNINFFNFFYLLTSGFTIMSGILSSKIPYVNARTQFFSAFLKKT